MTYDSANSDPSQHAPSSQPSDQDKEKAGLFRAGKVALWVWIIVPLVIIARCAAEYAQSAVSQAM